MSLKSYLERKNLFREMFGEELLTLPKHALVIHGHLEADLSPENLTCDGELSATQVRAKYRELTAALAELERDYAVYVKEAD
jgi:hypothetical protein